MDIFLPKGFEAGRARQSINRAARAPHLTVEAGGKYYPVLRRWATGFAVMSDEVPVLKGIVSLFDGAQHLGQCLITGSEQAGSEQIFSIKQAAQVDYAAAVEYNHAAYTSAAHG